MSEKKNDIKQSTQDRAAGNLHIVTGKMKETVGHLTQDLDLEAEGTAEKVAGKVQKIIGKIEKAVGQ